MMKIFLENCRVNETALNEMANDGVNHGVNDKAWLIMVLMIVDKAF